MSVDQGNSSRKPTDPELLGHFGLLRCESDGCQWETNDLGFSSLPVDGPSLSLRTAQIAAATTVTPGATVTAAEAKVITAAAGPLSQSTAASSVHKSITG